MNLNYRLRSLERAVGGGSNVCPACGNTRDGSLGQVVLLPIDLDNPCPPRVGPDTCAACGRRLVVRLAPITVDEK